MAWSASNHPSSINTPESLVLINNFLSVSFLKYFWLIFTQSQSVFDSKMKRFGIKFEFLARNRTEFESLSFRFEAIWGEIWEDLESFFASLWLNYSTLVLFCKPHKAIIFYILCDNGVKRKDLRSNLFWSALELQLICFQNGHEMIWFLLQILICRTVVNLKGASSSVTSWHLPLPWGRLWFNCGAYLTIAVKPLSRLQNRFRFRFALAFPKTGEGGPQRGGWGCTIRLISPLPKRATLKP